MSVSTQGKKEKSMALQKRAWTYEGTWADELTSTDLRAEFEAHSGE
jgi:hypothetical protein